MKSDAIGMPGCQDKTVEKELTKTSAGSTQADTKNVGSNRRFSTVDMWKLQRAHRTSFEMRRCMQ